ncbi:uncharacterized protein L969DRAFT_84081, partial [Mixia osmundae IAM 14324]
ALLALVSAAALISATQFVMSEHEETCAKPLALPAAPSHTEAPQTIEVNGQAFSLFDSMGPTVVNKDGTLSRITDWAEKTPRERANILRILGKRNQLRLDDLKQ